MSSLLPLLLVAVALATTLYPLFARRLGAPWLVRTGRLAQLQDRYQAALADLQDIELDREVGNLSDADYTPLRERYRHQAALLLRDLDAEQALRTPVPSARSNQHPGPSTRNGAARGGMVPSPFTGEGEGGGEAGRHQTSSLSWGLVLGTALAVMASVGVTGLYLRQVQQQAAQAPLAQLPITQPQGITIDDAGYWVAYAGGLLHSNDGKTWQRAGVERAVSVLLVRGSGSRLAIGRGLALESVDGGASWTPVATDLPTANVTGAQVLDDRDYAYVNGSGVFRSADGMHWAEIGPGVATPAGSLAVLRGTEAVLFLVTNGSVVRSTDDGHTWAAAAGAGNLALNGFVESIAADPDRNALYAATDRGLFFSTVLGTQWIQLPFRGRGAAIAVEGDKLAVVDADGRFFLSRDGGATWQG